jgi:26S proteasome non-ATPase regulatory subunit 10
MEAAREGDLERLRLELPEGADAAQVNRKDEDGRTALHWAAANRPRAVNTHADCVRLLLRRGSKVNTHDDGGWTPIMSACSAGNAEVVRLLIDAQALVDEEEENSQVTPLHLAASKAHLDVVRELLQAGARAQMVDGLGQLPLHRAAAAGHPAIVRLLLGEGSKVNAADKEGVTPLHLAMYEKHREVCVALLEAGASITMKTTQGETPLALAPDDFCALVLNRDADEMAT